MQLLNKRISLCYVQGLIFLRVKIMNAQWQNIFSSWKYSNWTLEPFSQLNKTSQPPRKFWLSWSFDRGLSFFLATEAEAGVPGACATATSVTALYFAIRRLDKTKENSSNGISTLHWPGAWPACMRPKARIWSCHSGSLAPSSGGGSERSQNTILSWAASVVLHEREERLVKTNDRLISLTT